MSLSIIGNRVEILCTRFVCNDYPIPELSLLFGANFREINIVIRIVTLIFASARAQHFIAAKKQTDLASNQLGSL